MFRKKVAPRIEAPDRSAEIAELTEGHFQAVDGTVREGVLDVTDRRIQQALELTGRAVKAVK